MVKTQIFTDQIANHLDRPRRPHDRGVNVRHLFRRLNPTQAGRIRAVTGLQVKPLTPIQCFTLVVLMLTAFLDPTVERRPQSRELIRRHSIFDNQNSITPKSVVLFLSQRFHRMTFPYAIAMVWGSG